MRWALAQRVALWHSQHNTRMDAPCGPTRWRAARPWLTPAGPRIAAACPQARSLYEQWGDSSGALGRWARGE